MNINESAYQYAHENHYQFSGESYAAELGFINGCKSGAAKQYWFAQFKKTDCDVWVNKAVDLLKGYEELEANIISADELWWPYAENDALRGSIYEKFIELQAKRNELLAQSTLQHSVVDKGLNDEEIEAIAEEEYPKLEDAQLNAIYQQFKTHYIKGAKAIRDKI